MRGPDAPTEFLVDVDMPEGATLREFKPENPIPGDTEGPWPVEVVEDGRQLAVVYPPSAHDAEGRPVASRLRIDGANLRLTVEHRGRLLAYPVLADPEVYVPQYEGQPSSWSGWRHQNFRSQTSIQQNHYPFFGASLGNYAYGPGLYLSMPTNQGYYNGDFSELIWQAPTDVFITRTRLNWMSHSPFYSGTFHGITNAPNSAWEGGLGYVNQNNERGPNPFGTAQHAFYGVTHDFCYGSPNCNLGGSDQNNVVVGLQALPPGCCMGTGANKAVAQVNSAELYLGDRFAPVLIGGVPPSRDWFDDTDARTRTVTPQVTDRGLGVKQIELNGAQTGETSKGFPCTGHPYDSPCTKDTRSAPRSLSYGLAEGISTLTVSGLDATLKRTSGGSWTERVDRSAPVITELSGPLFDARTQVSDRRREGVNDDGARLRVTATDAHSGVATVEVTAVAPGGVGTRLATTTGGTFDQTIGFSALADGTYTIEVRARDVVGAPASRHEVLRSFTIELDRMGDVYALQERNGNTDGPGELLGRELLTLDGARSRHSEEGLVETRRGIDCPAASTQTTGCAERRRLTDLDGGDQRLEVTVAATDDERVATASAAQSIAQQVPSDSATTGSLNDGLRPWQIPPPGHGSTFTRYVLERSVLVDERTVSETRTITIDTKTRLPLRETKATGSDVERDSYFTYELQRRTEQQLNQTEFVAQRDDGGPADETADFSGAPEENNEPEEPETTQEERVAYAQDFRAGVGLDSGLDFVRATFSDTILEKTAGRFGLPLLPAELSELLERERLVDLKPAIDDFAARYASSYAGAWIDHKAGGVLRIAFTQDAAARVAELKESFPLPDRLRAVTAQNTLASLKAVNTRVGDAFEELKASDGVVSAALDVVNNAVRVGVPQPTEDFANRLRTRFGAEVALVQEESPEPAATAARSYFATPPYFGGVALGRGGVAACSSAFSVRRGSLYRLLTAGHCFERGEVPTRLTRGADGKPRGINIGSVSASEYGGRLDAAQITIRRREASAYVLVQAGRGEVRQRISRQADSSDVFPGTMVCTLGINEDFARCNRILREGVTNNYPGGVTVRDLISTTNNGPAKTEIRPGDSGGAVIRRETAWGVLSGRSRSKDQAYFMPIANSSLRFKTFVVGLP